MATRAIKQTSFAGGELTPALYGRPDLDHYAIGAKTVRNFIVNYHGGVDNRPGTTYICEVEDSNVAGRLIPFQYSTSVTYVIELCDQKLRFVRDAAQIESGGSPYEVTSPWLEADLFRVKYAQDAEKMTLVHPDYTVRELSSTGDTSWTLGAATFGPGIDAPTGLGATGGGSGSTDYSYVVTAESDEDVPEESLPSTAATITNKSSSGTVDLTWTAVTGARRYYIYKDIGRNNTLSGVYGYIGVAENEAFHDNTLEPDYEQTPPRERTVFNASGDYPGTVAYYQQRRMFAGSDNKPQTLDASKTGLENNFLFSLPQQDDDAITYAIKAAQINEIRHLVPLRDLIALTSGGEWLLFGGGDNAVTPTNIAARAQGYRGASHIQPVVIGDNALFIQAKGNVVRDLAYSLESDGFSGRDLTVRSTHLFEGHEIVDWCYAQSPYSAIFAVRDDGALLVLTYLPEHQVWGWSKCDTEGYFESVCSVSEGDEDAVYFIVRRTVNGATKRYIERLNTRQWDDVREANFLDCSLTYDGRNTGATTMTVTGASFDSGDSVTVTASTSTFVAGDVGNSVVVRTTDSNGDEVFARLDITAYSSGTIVTCECVTDVPTELQAVATTTWERCVDEISGLDHLEGETVRVFGDGSDLGTFTVASGAITLDTTCAVVHAGLSYNSDLEMLDIDMPDSESVRSNVMSVANVALVVKDTRGVKVGPDSTDLKDLRIDDWTSEAYVPEPLHTGTYDVNTTTRWRNGGGVFIRQSAPVPCSILSVIREVDVGG